jgi:hypothetical protein
VHPVNWVVSTDVQITRRPDPGDMTNSLRTRPMSPTARRTGRGLALAGSGILLAAALSACGSSDPSSAGSSHHGSGDISAGPNSGVLAAQKGTIDPCSLLTEDQLSAIIGSAVTAKGPAVEVARGRSCTYTFKETGNTILDEGDIDIAAWHGSEFFAAGTVGAARTGVGDEAQDDSSHGVVLFRVGDDVVQVHVLSPDHKTDSVQIASAAAGQVAGASRVSCD